MDQGDVLADEAGSHIRLHRGDVLAIRAPLLARIAATARLLTAAEASD